jgi:FkbM family methyltransferase
MIKILRHSTKTKHAYWRMREMFERPAIENSEIIYRLQRQFRLNSGSHPQRTFRFSWGDFQYVNAGNLYGQFDEIFVRRQYAVSTDTPEPVIIDCGGNVGLSAIWFKLNYPKCHLTVYEADPDLAEILRINLNNAGMSDVQLRNEAVWITNGKVAFEKTGDDSGKIAANGSARYPCVDLVERLPDRVDLLKMDVEGAEFPILTRLCETGAIQKIRRLVCEFHIWQDKTDDFLETLCLLRSNNMQFSMNAAAGPHLGLAVEESPFEIIKRKQVLMEFYAWYGPSSDLHRSEKFIRSPSIVPPLGGSAMGSPKIRHQLAG